MTTIAKKVEDLAYFKIPHLNVCFRKKKSIVEIIGMLLEELFKKKINVLLKLIIVW